MHVWMQALKLGMLLQSISPLGGKFDNNHCKGEIYSQLV